MLPEFTPFPKIARLSREIVVTEKIDGTNACVYVGEDGAVLAGSRSQWLVSRKNGGLDNFGFAEWVDEHVEELRTLGPGRHFGEWWGSDIQRGYGLPKGEKRFSLFNTHRWESSGVRPSCCLCVPVLYRGPFDMSQVNLALEYLRNSGSRAAPGFTKPEGIVLFHAQGNVLFKKTLERDEEHKGVIS